METVKKTYNIKVTYYDKTTEEKHIVAKSFGRACFELDEQAIKNKMIVHCFELKTIIV